jgi:HKD family nuclease
VRGVLFQGVTLTVARGMHIVVDVYAEPLAAVRSVLAGADEVLLSVAFVQQRGINLLAGQLAEADRGRLITTTVFGATTMQGLKTAQDRGLRVRVLNMSTGTFHPKLYLGRHEERIAAALGSANLTGGLVSNIEAVTVLSGHHSVPQLKRLWDLAESWWSHDDSVEWSPEKPHGVVAEVLDDALLTGIRAALANDMVVRTLSDGKPNWVREITPDGIWVETERSRAIDKPPQLVEAWMIQIAWEWLRRHGRLSNRFLLATDGLNVKRSSFVCALLARLPEVRVTRLRPIELTFSAVRDKRTQPRKPIA